MRSARMGPPFLESQGLSVGHVYFLLIFYFFVNVSNLKSFIKGHNKTTEDSLWFARLQAIILSPYADEVSCRIRAVRVALPLRQALLPQGIHPGPFRRLSHRHRSFGSPVFLIGN